MTVDRSQEHQRQRPFRVSKSFRELLRKPRQQKHQHNLTLPLPSLPDDAGSPNDYIYDILYECQRGSWMVGYSSKTLLQFDANPWCDANMEYTPMDTKTYQLPDPTWQWVSKEWMVDMSGDVDEAGWEYSLKFHGAVWHGNYKHFRSFVRRRRWIRLRRRLISLDKLKQQQNDKKLLDGTTTTTQLVDNLTAINNKHTLSPKTIHNDKPSSSSTGAGPSSSSISDQEELINILSQCRMDRERLVVFEKALSTIPNASQQLLSLDLLNVFNFERTKCIVLQRILELRYTSQKDLLSIQLSTKEKQLLQSLGFYSDIQNILNQFEK